jgi:hypothetical protein
MRTAKSKAEASKKKQDEKREARTEARIRSGGVTVRDVERHLRRGIHRLRGPSHRVAYWTGKERGVAKRLLSGYGGELVLKAIGMMCSEWEDISRGQLDGDPSISLLWGMRHRLMARAQGVEPKKPKKSLNSDEYRADQVDDDDMAMGW